MPTECVVQSFRAETCAPVWSIQADDCEHSAAATGACRSDSSLSSHPDQSLSVLWIDDEVHRDDALLRLLAIEGVRIEIACSGTIGIAMARATPYDVMLLDLRLPDLFGLTVLDRLVAEVRRPIVVLTGYYFEPEIHADAVRRGAAALLHKPIIGTEDLIATLRQAIRADAGKSPEPAPMFGIVAASPSMREVIDCIRRIAPKAVNVLLSGETGTGKELVARALHEEGPRRKARFVAVNCAAIPEALFESELFGHSKGAFTGATAAKPGLFEAADGGTLFLDEIGELPLPLQARFLRCLENGEVRRVGETSTRQVDVRVIAATNRDLRDETSKGRFRLDLYYRVCGAHLHLPPLRERPEDIEALVRYWLPGASAWTSATIVGISPSALTTLQGHQWPGNVRELRHVFEHAMFATSGPMLTMSDIREPLEDAAWGVRPSHRELGPPRVALSAEDRQLLAVLESHRWNRSEAARSLGINRTTVWRALRRLGLE